jgi:hypothetical protein
LGVIREGMEEGEIRSDIDPYLVRSVVLGTIEHMVIRWVLLGKPENLEDFVDPLTDLVMDGIGSKQGPGPWNVRLTIEPAEQAPATANGRKTAQAATE